MTKSTVKAGNYKVGYKRPPKERQFGQPNSNPRRISADDMAKLRQIIKDNPDIVSDRTGTSDVDKSNKGGEQ